MNLFTKTIMLTSVALSTCVFGDAINEIENWNASLSTGDKEAKYCKMSSSAFSFFRGTNHLFWKAFTDDSRLQTFGNEKTRVWVQGDAHIYNFGAFDDDQGKIVYALNDFDESTIADYQYDVWRMAVSLVLAMRENNDAGVSSLSQNDQAAVIDAFSEHYLDTIASYRGNDHELHKVFSKENTYGKLNDFLRDVESKNSRQKMLDKWSYVDGSTRVFDFSNSDLRIVDSTTRADLTNALQQYRSTLSGSEVDNDGFFTVKDIAMRLNAGTGSLGMPRYFILIEGDSVSESDDRILDIKLQQLPTADCFLGTSPVTLNYAQLHALAEKALSVHTNDLLGYLFFDGDTYSVRERSPYKKSLDVSSTLTSLTRFKKLAEQWGDILATQHARSDKDFNADYIPYSLDKQVDKLTDTHHSEFRALVRSVAFNYADRVRSDFENFNTELKPVNCP